MLILGKARFSNCAGENTDSGCTELHLVMVTERNTAVFDTSIAFIGGSECGNQRISLKKLYRDSIDNAPLLSCREDNHCFGSGSNPSIEERLSPFTNSSGTYLRLVNATISDIGLYIWQVETGEPGEPRFFYKNFSVTVNGKLLTCNYKVCHCLRKG